MLVAWNFGNAYSRVPPDYGTEESLDIASMKPDENGLYAVDDMYLDDDQFNELFFPEKVTRQADTPDRRWPNGVVPYKFDQYATQEHKTIIPEVLARLNALFAGCVHFR